MTIEPYHYKNEAKDKLAILKAKIESITKQDHTRRKVRRIPIVRSGSIESYIYLEGR